MAIKLADNIQVQAPKSLDSKYLDKNTNLPYTGVTQVAAIVPSGERHIGLTVNISGTEYWYKNNTTNLVLKTMGGTLSGATNGIHLANSGTAVALGGVLTGNTYFSNGILRYGDIIPPTFTDGRDIIDKDYADAIVTGLRPKAAVKYATTANLTFPFTGLVSIDGQTPLSGDRILVKDQVPSGQTNGIWVASAGTWTRAIDFDGNPSGEVVSGSYMWVLSGNTNANTAWVLDTPDPIFINNITGTSLNFVLFSQVTDVIAGTGITVTMITGTHVVSINPTNQFILANALTGTTSSFIGTSGRNVCLTATAQTILGGALTGTTGSYIGTSGRNVCLNSVSQAVIGSAVTGATNGLGLSGRKVCFGGNPIDTNTNVSICNGHLLTLGGDYLAATGATILLGNSSSPVTDAAKLQYTKSGTIGGYIRISPNTSTQITSYSGATNKSIIFNHINALQYCGDYSANYTSRTLVDKGYVTGYTQSQSNLVNVCNVISNYTTVSSDSFIGASGATLICLYNTPVKGQRISISDIKGNALSNPITICSGSKTINGMTDTCSTINTDYGSITFIYNQYFWSTVAFIN